MNVLDRILRAIQTRPHEAAAQDRAIGFDPLPETLTPGERLLMNYHRNNLRNGTYIDDDQGMTTVNISGVANDGRVVNVPGYFGGQRLNASSAERLARAMGIDRFPSFPLKWDGPIEQHPANTAARALHGLIDRDGIAFRRFMGIPQ